MAALLYFRRYFGIYHDSILYLGQGLMTRWPSIYGQDMFFQHGSQTDYSVLPLLLGKAFGVWTPPVAFMWGTLASLLLFWAASWYALRALMPARQRYWAWLATLCLPAMYGVVSIFSYNEKFLTARPLAEGCSLLAVGMFARGWTWRALLALAAAAAFHPLQALGAAAILWVWLVFRDRRWMHATWLAVPTMLLAVAGIAPFDGLFRRPDPEWMAAIHESYHLFVTRWDLNSLKALGFDVVLLAFGWRLLGTEFSQWCRAALIGLGLGIGANLVLVDWLELILPVSLQPWRVQWLAHWFAIAALAALLFRDMQARDYGRILLLVLAAQLAWGETAVGWVGMILLYIAWPRLVQPPRAHLRPLLACVFALMLAFLLANHLVDELQRFGEAGYRLDAYAFDLRILVFPALALGLPLLGLLAWERSGLKLRLAILVAGVVPLLAWSAWTWDGRTAMMRQFENSAFREDVFGVMLPNGAQVFWEPEALVGSWLVLQRPNYFSPSQLAGQMFNRGTFVVGRERRTRMQPLMDEGARCRRDPAAFVAGQCQISEAALHAACEPGTTRAPDYLALSYPLRYPALGIWLFDAPQPAQRLIYRLYGCAELMQLMEAGNDVADGHPDTTDATGPFDAIRH
ncbi:hypothetical protein QF205_04715 [Luteimonas composti]|uniref:YfhO family protein n=1 Tax=Luteimonas composti TaxID=398257 RepID=A0ABT6MPK9_9GAMM|nr:hypothetical protein [Luteimonas composti]MDH7452388.1 hypothetical protein [Luteimonas composti]